MELVSHEPRPALHPPLAVEYAKAQSAQNIYERKTGMVECVLEARHLLLAFPACDHIA